MNCFYAVVSCLQSVVHADRHQCSILMWCTQSHSMSEQSFVSLVQPVSYVQSNCVCCRLNHSMELDTWVLNELMGLKQWFSTLILKLTVGYLVLSLAVVSEVCKWTRSHSTRTWRLIESPVCISLERASGHNIPSITAMKWIRFNTVCDILCLASRAIGRYNPYFGSRFCQLQQLSICMCACSCRGKYERKAASRVKW